MALTSTAVLERWPLIDLKLAIMFLRSLYMTGMSPDESLEELSRLQPAHAAFWQSAARHTKSGKPLHDYLKHRWPDNLVSPIRIAETSGRLNDVFKGMEQALQQQIEARKLLTTLYYPIGVAIGGLASAVFFIAIILPDIFAAMRFAGKLPAIVVFTRAAQSLIADYGVLTLGGILAVVAYGVWQWKENESFRASVLSLINYIPGVGWSSRWIWFAVWSNYVSIMIKADIPATEVLRLTSATLPPHLQPAVAQIISQLERGQSLTKAATSTRNPDDPLHVLPIHITNAFRMTDRSGQGAEQFAIASETLFTPGAEVLARSIKTINYVFIGLSAFMLLIPASMYLQTVITLVRSTGGAR